MKMKINKLPSLEFLNECFEIDLNSPSALKWKIRPLHHFKNQHGCNIFNSKVANNFCGKKQKDGYYIVSLFINRKMVSFVSHRIVYAIYNKITNFENHLVDHIDRNPGNNNPENLRLVCQLENRMNSKLNKFNKSGYTGVHKYKDKWQSTITINYRRYILGYFINLDDAVKARAEAEEKSLPLYYKGFSKNEIISNTSYPEDIFGK